MDNREQVTRLLEVSQTDAAAPVGELLPIVYEELRTMAHRFLRRERPDHTLQPTALANEAFLRLADQSRVEWRGRAHFLAVAATAMRRILVDHARRKGARKRDAGGERVSLSDASGLADQPELQVLDLDDALTALAALDERKARIVELRFFVGLNLEETAEVVGVAPATVERDWYMARAWLRARLER